MADIFSPTKPASENVPQSTLLAPPKVGQGGGDYVQQTAYAMDSNNPLMESAKRKAMEYANGRGLINSTIGQASAVDAMGQVAATLGVKNADANNQFTLSHQNASNQQGLIGSQLNSDLSKLDKQQSFAGNQAALDRTQQTGLIDKQQSFAGGQAELDRNQQTTIADKQIQAESDRLTSQQNFTGGQADKDRQQQNSILATQQAFQSAQASQDRDVQLQTLAQQAAQFGASNLLDQQKLAVAKESFSQNTFTNYAASMMALVTSQLTPEAKTAAQDTLNAIYFGSARESLGAPSNARPSGDPRVVMKMGA